MRFLTVYLAGILTLFLFCACGSVPNRSEKRKENEIIGFDLTVIPDKEDPDAGNWFVDAFLEDKPYRFYLDTGAANTSVVWDDYTSNFKSTGISQTSGALVRHSNEQIVLPEVRVGSLRKSNLAVSRASQSAQGKSNLLGMNFLKDFALNFLFDENRVEIFDRSKSEENVRFNELFLDERNHPYVDVKYKDNVVAKGVWDTGAGMTVVDISFLKKHPKLFKMIGSASGKDSSGTRFETPLYLMESFELGGFIFPASKVAVVDLSVPNSTIKTPMDFILGYNILNKANWVFDFPNKKWAVSRKIK